MISKKKKKKKKKVFAKIQSDFSAEIQNSNVFSAQNQVISEKKINKKKKVFAKIQSDFSAEIQYSNVFSAQNQVISKKKKKVFANAQVQTFEGGLFSDGGAILHFSQKIGLKSTKNMRFCILHKPMGGGGSSPPAPPWLRYWEWPRNASRGAGPETEKCDYKAINYSRKMYCTSISPVASLGEGGSPWMSPFWGDTTLWCETITPPFFFHFVWFLSSFGAKTH